MLFCILKRFCRARWFVKNAGSLLQGARVETLQRIAFVWSKSGSLLFSHLLRGDFRQLLRSGFTDKHSDFVIGWSPATFQSELLNCGVRLGAPYAVLFE